MSVITEDGSFYAFNVKYAKEPDMLNIEMKDFIHDGSAVNRPNRSTSGRLQGKNSMDIYLKELGSESPVLVRLVMKSIWKQNERIVKHIGSKSFGIQFLLKGIYTHNGLLYFHTEIKNTSNVPFDVDYIVWKIVDKKVAKRTAIQEQVIQPLRTQRSTFGRLQGKNFVMNVGGNSSERTVWTMDKFFDKRSGKAERTMPDDKCLVVELAEKNGGHHQSFVIENTDLVRARVIWLRLPPSRLGHSSELDGSRCSVGSELTQYITETMRSALPLCSAKNLPMPEIKGTEYLKDLPDEEPQFSNVEVLPLGHYALRQYLTERAIPFEVASRYCKELHYDLRNKRYFAIGFPNDKGGYEVRNKFFKGCVAPKGTTFIKAGNEPGRECNVFEGFFDFLSAVTINQDAAEKDNLVLNSIIYLRKSTDLLSHYDHVHAYLDNDDAGRKAVQTLKDCLGEKVIDHIADYKGCKDFNEFLVKNQQNINHQNSTNNESNINRSATQGDACQSKNIFHDYMRFCHYKGRKVKSIEHRRYVEFSLLFIQ